MEILDIGNLKQDFANELRRISIDNMDLVPNSSSIKKPELYEMADEFALHTIASLINYWYHSNANFNKPLNAHQKDLTEGIGEDENNEKTLKKYRTKLIRLNDNIREEHRKYHLPVPETYKPISKRAGIPISTANMQTIRNFAGIDVSSPVSLFRGIQCGSAIKWRADKFYTHHAEYEQWVSGVSSNEPDDVFLYRAVDFYSCQRKLHIDLIMETADYMATNKIKDFPVDRYLAFFGTVNINIFYIFYINCKIESSQVLTYADKIPLIFLENDESFEIEKTKWIIMRLSQTILTNKVKSEKICDGLTVEFAANFFRNEYNLFEKRRYIRFGPPKAPDKLRIRNAKTIMKGIYAYPDTNNPDISHQ